jgi:cyclophilin family peptidyl-prolyl cis-trans isomerase
VSLHFFSDFCAQGGDPTGTGEGESCDTVEVHCCMCIVDKVEGVIGTGHSREIIESTRCFDL